MKEQNDLERGALKQTHHEQLMALADASSDSSQLSSRYVAMASLGLISIQAADAQCKLEVEAIMN